MFYTSLKIAGAPAVFLLLVLLEILRWMTLQFWYLCVTFITLWDIHVDKNAELRFLLSSFRLADYVKVVKSNFILPYIVHPMDDVYASISEQEGVEILGVAETEYMSLQDVQRIFWNDFFRHEPKSVCSIKKVLWKKCWVPLSVVQSDPELKSHAVVGPIRWTKNDRPFSLDEVFSVFHIEEGSTVEDAVSTISDKRLTYDRPLWRISYLKDEESDEKTKLVIQAHHCFTDGVAVNFLFQRNMLKNYENDEEMTRILTSKARIIAYFTKLFYSSLDIIPLVISTCINAYIKSQRINQGKRNEGSKRLFSKHFPLDMSDVKAAQEKLAELTGKKPTINDLFTSSVASVRSEFFNNLNYSKDLEDSPKFWIKDSPVADSSTSTIASTPTSTIHTDFSDSPVDNLSAREVRSELTSTSNTLLLPCSSYGPPCKELTSNLFPKLSLPITTLVVVNVRDKVPDSLDNAISPCLIDLPRPSYNEENSKIVKDVWKSLEPLKKRARALVTKQMIQIGFGLLPARISSPIMNHMSCNAEILLSNLKGPKIDGYIGPAKLHDLKFWSPGKPPVDFTVSLVTFGNQSKISATVTVDASFDTASLGRWKEKQRLLGEDPKTRLPDILVQEIIHKMTGKNCRLQSLTIFD